MLGTVALVGRPSAGKSTIFNRIVGERRSIVEETPGVTRDRLYAHAEWLTKQFTVIDTGGIQLKDAPFQTEIRAQCEIAMEEADLVVFVTDAHGILTDDDRLIARMLHQKKKKTILVANKIDNIESIGDMAEYYRLGFGEPMAVSGVHGIGIGDLLDRIVKELPEREVPDYQGAISFSLIDVGIATTIHFIYPVFVTIGCVLFFKEKLGFKKVVSLLVATCGIACFFFGVDTSQGLGGMFLGLALAVISGVTYAFYIIYLDKSGLKNQPVFKITFYVALMSTIAMGVYGAAMDDLALKTLTPASWGISLAFSLLCTVVALSLLQIGIKYVGASTAAILTTFEPITSIVCGVLLLGESITAVKIVACSLIMIGVVMLSLAKENKNEEAGAPGEALASEG